jgi:hypothetical protein
MSPIRLEDLEVVLDIHSTSTAMLVYRPIVFELAARQTKLLVEVHAQANVTSRRSVPVSTVLLSQISHIAGSPGQP